MSKGLFIVSLQHELAMAIGNKFDLKAMLKGFLKVCLNRLDLTSTHMHVYCDQSGMPSKLIPLENTNYRHILSIPKNKLGQTWSKNTILKNVVEQLNNMIKFSDIAMYEAKRTKNQDGRKYQLAMSAKIKNCLAYVDDMKQGLEQDDFTLYYQAQYNHYGDIIGAEALLRWQHPLYANESPTVYIPIAEESDLILDIGQ